METTQPHTLNLTGVLYVSRKIILATYIHFLTLSLFFLPLSFSLTTTATLHLRLPNHLFSGDHQRLLNYHLIYTLIMYILTLCAICTITYTTHHAFSGSPVNLSDSLNSLTSSFFRLASTAILAHVLIALIAQTFILLVHTLLNLVNNLGFAIDHNSTYFMWFSTIACLILIAIVVYFYVEWSLAFVVVVVESKWGYAPLLRSSYLIKGMRSVSLLLMLYFGVLGAIIVWICSKTRNVHGSWPFYVMFGLICMMSILRRITAANTVLYNYCLALHGELEIKVVEGFDHEYMSLPGDDDKAPQVVTVVTA